MIIILRIVLTALWLIFTNLILLKFNPGGRYLILLEAIAIGSITHLIRTYMCKNMDFRIRSLLSTTGVVLGFALIRLVFSGIRLTLPGVLLVYLGLVCVEMVLPGEDLKSVES